MHKIKLVLATVFIVTVILADAQTCLKIKQGQHFVTTSTRYFNDDVFLPAFAKMKESKKDEAVAAFNAKVLSGAIKGTPGTYDYTAKNVSVQPGSERAILVTTIAGKQYESIAACINDTVYYTRLIGINYAVDAKGDTIGFGILGVQVIPNNLKVGDILAPYEDIGMTFPTSSTKTEKKKILTGVETTVSKHSDFGYDANHGGWGTGTTTVTETKNIYETIDVSYKESLQFSSSTINYAVAQVVAEEEVTVNGVKYKAFKIESESWTKGSIDKSYDIANTEWRKAKEAEDAKIKGQMEKRGIRKGYTNALGYVVTYRTEWYVPGLGMARLDIYDNYGNILAHAVIDAVK